MTTFKPGDMFIPHKPKEKDTGPNWVRNMDKFDGKTLIVDAIDACGYLEVDETEYIFHPDWCEKVEETDITKIK